MCVAQHFNNLTSLFAKKTTRDLGLRGSKKLVLLNLTLIFTFKIIRGRVVFLTGGFYIFDPGKEKGKKCPERF